MGFHEVPTERTGVRMGARIPSPDFQVVGDVLTAFRRFSRREEQRIMITVPPGRRFALAITASAAGEAP